MSAPAPRSDFPALARTVREGRPLVYLDSAATSQKPQQVLDALIEAATVHNGAVKRGSHQLAEEASVLFEDSRQKVASFIGARPDEIVWTSGSTQSLNLIAYVMSNIASGRASSIAPSALTERLTVGPGDSIVTTRAEHHANLIPWQELCERTGATLRWLECDEDGRIDLSSLDVIDETTKLVTFAHIANVTGAVSPVEDIVAAAASVGALTVLDACQSVAHMPLDVKELGVDFAVFSGHKMLGPTGIGVLYGRRELLEAMPPYQFGGSMVEVVTMEKTTFASPPERFEAGTQPVAEAVGLAAAVDYLTGIGMERIAAHERELTARLLTGIAAIPAVRILGPRDSANRTATVAFTVDGLHPHDVGQVLDMEGVAVRTGHHCAQPIHRHLGARTSSRASAGPYTTADDIDIFLQALAGVRSYFGLADT